MKTIEEKLNQLPPEDRKEVEDLVEFLLKNRKERAKGKAEFKWAGILRDLRERYTSVELQHEISRWRIGEK